MSDSPSTLRDFDIWRDDPRGSVMAMDHIRHRFALRLIPRRPLEVIDLGCGDGFLSVALARAGHKVTAIDSSPERLRKFADRAVQAGVRQVLVDFSTVQPGQFQADALFCMEVLEHIPDIEGALRLAASFLRPGGTAIFSVPMKENLFEGRVECPKCGHGFHRDGHLHSFLRGDLDRLVDSNGFRVDRHWEFQSVFTRQLQLAVRLRPGALLLGVDRVFCRLFPELGRRYIVRATRA